MPAFRQPSQESSRPILETSRRSGGNNLYSDSTKTPSNSSSRTQTGPNLSTTSLATMDARLAELELFTDALSRLDNQGLQKQRYNLSPQQESAMQVLALGAKVQRALDRRLSTQDAVLKPKPKAMVEKITA